MTFEPAYAGQFLRDYEPPLVSLNTTLNYFLTNPVKITPSATITMEVQFPDVSFWQGDINFDIMATKTKAIIIRAGQNKWRDDEFEDNYRKAKEKGLIVGAYWFYDGRASPREQAELLISLLRGKKLELEVYIDWEHNYGGAHEGLRNVVAMMELVEAAGLNIKGVGLYTGYYFFRANSNPITNASQYAYLKTKPLWEAWYTNAPSQVLIPAPWNELTHWQYGTPTVQWGQETFELDLNFFNGSRIQFFNRYGTAVPQPPEPPTGENMYAKLTPTTNVSRTIREQTAYPVVPHIMGDKKYQIDGDKTGKAHPQARYEYASDIMYQGILRARKGDVWWNVYEANGQTTSGWVAEKHLGQVLLDVDFIDETPTPQPNFPTLNVQLSDPEGNYPTITIEWKPNEFTD